MSEATYRTELVSFHGDVIEALKTLDGKVFVSVKRCCESISVDVDTQTRKLKACGWATTVIMTVVAQDGRLREQTMIDLDSLPMWMATIHANKVAAQVRPKLLAFQKEAKEVLARHFFGGRPATVDPMVAMACLMNELVGRVQSSEVRITTGEEAISSLAEEVSSLQHETWLAQRAASWAMRAAEAGGDGIVLRSLSEFCRANRLHLSALELAAAGRRLTQISQDRMLPCHRPGKPKVFGATARYSDDAFAEFFRDVVGKPVPPEKKSPQVVPLPTDVNYMTIAGFYHVQGEKIDRREASMIGRDVADFCRSKGVEIHKVGSERDGYVNSYPVGALHDWWISRMAEAG